MDQWFLAIFTCTSIWLANDKSDDTRKFACWFGLLSQPFWFYSAITTMQFGVLFVNFVITFTWLRGVYNFWLTDEQRARVDANQFIIALVRVRDFLSALLQPLFSKIRSKINERYSRH